MLDRPDICASLAACMCMTSARNALQSSSGMSSCPPSVLCTNVAAPTNLPSIGSRMSFDPFKIIATTLATQSSEHKTKHEPASCGQILTSTWFKSSSSISCWMAAEVNVGHKFHTATRIPDGTRHGTAAGGPGGFHTARGGTKPCDAARAVAPTS